jgi:hypothetical protein
VHSVPQGNPHALDQLVIAPWSVIVGSDTIESTLRIEQLRFVQRQFPLALTNVPQGQRVNLSFNFVLPTHIDLRSSARQTFIRDGTKTVASA